MCIEVVVAPNPHAEDVVARTEGVVVPPHLKGSWRTLYINYFHVGYAFKLHVSTWTTIQNNEYYSESNLVTNRSFQ